MSEKPVEGEEEKQPKKKGGKLPIIFALVVVLAGGGFFMMKGKGKAEPPPVKLGAIEPLQEFLVNLREANVYLRAEIALHMKDTFKKEELDKNLPAVRDAIVTVLRSKSIQDVRSVEDMDKLKKELVEAINKVLEAAEAAAHPEEEEPAAEEASAAPATKDSKKQGSKSAGESKDPHADAPQKDQGEPKPAEHPDWDSQNGPVLKLYFTSFATQ